MSEERFIRIEGKLENHDKEFHSIAESLNGINEHMQTTNKLLHQMLITDERFTAKINTMQSDLNAKILANGKSIEMAHDRINKHDETFSWVNKVVLTVVIVGIIGATITFGKTG